jgi:hypothetical protein
MRMSDVFSWTSPTQTSPLKGVGIPIATTSPARPPVSIISRTIASSQRSRKSPPGALLDQQPTLVVVELLDHLVVELRRLEVRQLVGVDVALRCEPGGEAAYGQLT